MIFWLAIILGAFMAMNAVQIGFYGTWIMFFHVLLSVYMAIFWAPIIITDVTSATATSWGFALTMVSIAIATLSIGYGICFLCLSGNFSLEFPKTFDTLVAGFVGFLTGFLILSFLAFAFCLSPLSQFSLFKMIGLDTAVQTTNTAYMCWWCDWMHCLVGSGVPRSSEEDIRLLVTKATAPPAQIEDANKSTPPPKPPVVGPKQKQLADVKSGNKAPDAKKEQPKTAPPPAPPTPPVDPHRRPNESWEEEFARRHVVVHSADALKAAIAKPEMKIIEIADTLTINKLDGKQKELVQHWVSEGGVVWATNDVLTLFGIKASKLVWWGGALNCVAPPGKFPSPILSGCKKVAIKNAGGKSHALAANGAVPLLVLEKDIPFEDKAGTPCWSVVPYGRGWASDLKIVDTTQFDGGQFWANFCKFCLGRELTTAVAEAKPAAGGDEQPTPTATPKADLSGTWQASNGDSFRIYDEGEAITIDWVSGKNCHSLSGTLVRRGDNPASVVFSGKVDATFAADPQKQYAIELTMTVSDPDSLRVRSTEWPVWNNKGKYLGTRPGLDTWKRSDNSQK